MKSKRYDIFVSYSHSDRELVQQFAHLLDVHRVRVWFDGWEMRPGDVLRERISEGIANADYLLVVLSPAALSSNWVKYELNSSMIREIEQGHVVVIPALAPGVEHQMLPNDLRGKLYVDLRDPQSRAAGVQQIVALVNPEARPEASPPPDISGDETNYQRIIARSRPDSAPEAAQLFARSLLGRGDTAKAKLALQRAIDFEGSAVEASMARELARLLAQEKNYRRAAEICLLAGANQPIGIAGVDYFLVELQKVPQKRINRFFSARPSEYFIEQVELIERFFEVQGGGGLLRGRHIEGEGMVPIEDLVDNVFGRLYPRDEEVEQRKKDLRVRITAGDPDDAPEAAYRFGELLESEQHRFQAECAFEWARGTRHPTIYPLASNRLAHKYVTKPEIQRRYFQAAICFGDAELAREAAYKLAKLLDRAGDSQSAQFLRQEWDQAMRNVTP